MGLGRPTEGGSFLRPIMLVNGRSASLCNWNRRRRPPERRRVRVGLTCESLAMSAALQVEDGTAGSAEDSGRSLDEGRLTMIKRLKRSLGLEGQEES